MTKFKVRNLRLNEISTVDRPAQSGAVAVLIKSAGSDADIRKNATAVAAGEAPAFALSAFEDAMLRRADELGREQRTTPEQALLKGLTTDRELMDLAHAANVARASEYGVAIQKKYRTAA